MPARGRETLGVSAGGGAARGRCPARVPPRPRAHADGFHKRLQHPGAPRQRRTAAAAARPHQILPGSTRYLANTQPLARFSPPAARPTGAAGRAPLRWQACCGNATRSRARRRAGASPPRAHGGRTRRHQYTRAHRLRSSLARSGLMRKSAAPRCRQVAITWRSSLLLTTTACPGHAASAARQLRGAPGRHGSTARTDGHRL